ncbi:MAG: isoprenylcysteine carboxylmethyltransferase family protein [Hydrococcus sp. Prado102]|jgi:protein-S-isoprenylcysteine O-methyltransferase Ste14|nr:isoprenylcysteine carboxylmethyltransferase family protein [Hydrococcus sp. Prado102]
MKDIPAYGLWTLVVINSLVFIIFAFSFTKPKSSRDWRAFGAFSAFIVALFTEMYGFPLTIYLLSGWLQSRYPQLNLLSHDAGHLWWTLLGMKGDPHFNFLHILSNLFILGGFILLASAWEVLYKAQRSHTLARSGPYATIRHPQYVAFIAIMFGFLLQWPTILTLLMFPILLTMYVRLARREEREVRAEMGEEYDLYAANTPAFFPRWGRTTQKQSSHEHE